MKSSLEIAQEAELLPIETIAERTGLTPDEFEPYGRHKAKISLDVASPAWLSANAFQTACDGSELATMRVRPSGESRIPFGKVIVESIRATRPCGSSR